MMFTDLGKQKGLVFFGVLAFLVAVIIILVCCLDFNGGPSTGAEILASVPFIVGKSQWSKLLRNESINGLVGDPWDIQGLTASSVNAQLYTVGASNCSQAQYKDAVAQTLGQIDVMIRAFEKYDKYFVTAASTSEIYSARLQLKIAGFLAIDGGYALDSRLSALRDYYRSRSSMDTSTANDVLDSFGENVVGEMNRLGILIDLTGSNEAIQLQTIQLSRAPVIFTSSSCSNLTAHPMNVADDVLRALGAKGGLMMISFTAEQCCGGTNCTVENIVEHINHTANIAGKSSVGIGGDVGMSIAYPQGIANSVGYADVFELLLVNGTWTVSELQGLAGNNFMRVMENVETVAKTMKEEGHLPNEAEISLNIIPERGCYSETSDQLMSQRALPFADALMSFQHKMSSFIEPITETTSPGYDTTTTSTESDSTTNNSPGDPNKGTSPSGYDTTTSSKESGSTTHSSPGGPNTTITSSSTVGPSTGGLNNGGFSSNQYVCSCIILPIAVVSWNSITLAFSMNR